jgi:NADH:ubiquinone oxidoreductase subunit C
MLSNISKNKFKLFSTQINHEFTSSLNVKSFDEIKQMVKLFPSRVYYRVNGEYVIKTTPERLYSLLVLLKYHTNFRYSQLRGLTAMDHPTSKLRFEVVYFLLSIQNSRRLSISVSLAEGTSLPSIVSLYSSAG